MNIMFLFKRQIWALLVPLLIITLCIFVSQLDFQNSNQEALSLGITFDLLITSPLIYFLLIRKTHIPLITIIPLFILGIIIASAVLSKEQQFFLNLVKTWVLPLIEFTLLILVIWKIRKTVKSYKYQKKLTFDFFTALKTACLELIPQQKLATIFSTEIAVFYYGFLSWRKQKLNENEFTYHKNSATPALFIAFMFMILIETFVVHLLLNRLSETAAWILSVLSLYSVVSLLGFLKSIYQRRISINSDKLILRYGILGETEIPFTNIASIEINSGDFTIEDGNRKLSPLGNLESHNVILHLKQENTLLGLYGSSKKFKKIAFFVDEKETFQKQVERCLS